MVAGFASIGLLGSVEQDDDSRSFKIMPPAAILPSTPRGNECPERVTNKNSRDKGRRQQCRQRQFVPVSNHMLTNGAWALKFLRIEELFSELVRNRSGGAICQSVKFMED